MADEGSQDTESDNSIRQSIATELKAYSWGDLVVGAIIGGIVGLLISVAFSPFLAPIATQVYTQYEVAGYEQPDIDVEADRFPTSYKPGQFVEQHDLLWRANYSIYSIRVEHNGGPDIERLRLRPHLPGCVVAYDVQSSKFGEEIRILGSGLGGLEEQEGLEPWQCTPIIEVDSLPDDERFRIEFITVNSFQPCDLLIGLNSSKKFVYEYSWTESGVEFTPTKIGEVTLAGGEYDEVHNIIRNSTKLPVADNGSAYIYGDDSGNPGRALGGCLE